MVSSVYWHHPIQEQVSAVGNGTVSAVELALQTREAIVRQEPNLHAWVELTDNVAEQADTRTAGTHVGPLKGISIGVKDLIDVEGLPTRAGSTVTSEDPVANDAPCVARFRELGAVVQGKTVTTEFGYFAPGPTRNPHSPEHTPGGSSSGSAAAVGAGGGPIALGSQTAGSLTRPASYCGAAGLVLSQGTTDLSGITGLSESLDSLGILARSSEDLRYAYSAFVGPQQSTATTTVGSALIWDGSDMDDVEPSMRRLLADLPALLDTVGIATATFEWDDHVRTLANDHITVMSYEAAATLREVFDKDGDHLSAPLRSLVESGRRIDAGERDAALVRRDRSRALLSEMLGSDTVVIGPAALGAAPHGLGATGSPILSRPWQLLGSPVVVVPGARTTSGLPLGLQLIGYPGSEMQLLDLATRLEPAMRTASES